MKLVSIVSLLAVLFVQTVQASPACTPVKDAAPYFKNQLTTVMSLVQGTDLESLFSETKRASQPITLLLPTNAAFGKLPTDVTEAVKKDAKLRQSVLFDHAIDGRLSYIQLLAKFETLPYLKSGVTPQALVAAQFPQSLNKGDFFFSGSVFASGGTNLIAGVELNWGSSESAFRGAFRDGAAKILGVNYDSCLGVVHVIDTVITRRAEH